MASTNRPFARRFFRSMLAIRHLRQLVTCAGPAPRCGPRQRDVAVIIDGAIIADGERIVYAGPDAALPLELRDAGGQGIAGRDLAAVRGFVDAHTHAV